MAGSPTGVRIPPQSLDAEKALLGSIMLKPECMYDISDMLSSDSFYVGKHTTIYKAMKELFSKSDPIDVLSVSARLKATKNLERIGGSSYLTELVKYGTSNCKCTALCRFGTKSGNATWSHRCSRIYC